MQGECDIKTEKEIEFLLPQVKEHMGLPEPGRGKEESSPRWFEESTAWLTL